MTVAGSTLSAAALLDRERVVAEAARVAAARWGIPAALLMAHVAVESDFNPAARNMTGGDLARGGSYGLVQMSLQTARALGYQGDGAGLLVIPTNLDLGARYLRDLTAAAARGGYGLDSAVSAYNAGGSPFRPGDGKRVTVERATPAEARRFPFVNQSYVDAVLERVKRYAALGFSMDAPTFAARGGSAGLAWAALGLVLAAIV